MINDESRNVEAETCLPGEYKKLYKRKTGSRGRTRSNNVRARVAGGSREGREGKRGRTVSEHARSGVQVENAVEQCPSTRGRRSGEETRSDNVRARAGKRRRLSSVGSGTVAVNRSRACGAYSSSSHRLPPRVLEHCSTVSPLWTPDRACSDIVRPRFPPGPPTARARTPFDRVFHLDLRLRVLERRSTAFSTSTRAFSTSPRSV
jgi:hypothetical protein